jgi:5,10-methenyltetrahydrofolate synthetase
MLARAGEDLAGRVISCYWPIKGELDLRPWMTGLHEQRAVVALPVVERLGEPLDFRRWAPGVTMERGHWNIPVPPATAERLRPEICLAPLVGWDDEGYRLGYGGGYFDRTLAALPTRPLVIGVGLQSARLGTIAPQPHDVPTSVVVTEAGVQVESGRGRW